MPLFILSVKLLKTTTDVAARKKSNENHLKLDNCQLNRISVDTLGLLATWPEFWAIGLSFFGFILNFAFLIMWPPHPLLSNFSKNSSVLETPPVPHDGLDCCF